MDAIVDSLPKPSTLHGTVEYQVKTAASVVQINSYHWNEAQEAVFKTDSPIINFVLSRCSADIDGEFLEASWRSPRPVGDILFMPPNYTFHSCWVSGERRSMCCVLDNETFSDFFEFDWKDSKLLASLNICNGAIHSMMIRLVAEARTPSFASDMLVESLSTAIAVELRRHFDMVDPEDICIEHALSTVQLRRIRERLSNEDAKTPLTVLGLAKEENMSLRHFSRLFRASTGISVTAYVAQIRLGRAKNLLDDQHMLIKEVAYRCCFQSTSSFSSSFRQATSLTPQQYRNACVR